MFALGLRQVSWEPMRMELKKELPLSLVATAVTGGSCHYLIDPRITAAQILMGEERLGNIQL